MNNYAQDSPLMEAMAFNPVNLLTAALNNFWAWLSAAFHFCRLPTPPSCHSMTRISTITKDHSKKPEDQIQKGPPQTTPSKRKEEEGVLTRGISSKELFRVNFKEDRENYDQVLEGSGDEAVVKRWSRARALKLKVEMRAGAGELGWYVYQDIRVIDGSVVRLWEEERERSSPPPRRYRRGPSLAVATASSLFYSGGVANGAIEIVI